MFPLHDTAFASGLLTANGGLRIHRAPSLVEHPLTDRVAESYFRQPKRACSVIAEPKWWARQVEWRDALQQVEEWNEDNRG